MYETTIAEQARRDRALEEVRAAQIREVAQTDPRTAARLVTRRSRPRR